MTCLCRRWPIETDKWHLASHRVAQRAVRGYIGVDGWWDGSGCQCDWQWVVTSWTIFSVQLFEVKLESKAFRCVPKSSRWRPSFSFQNQRWACSWCTRSETCILSKRFWLQTGPCAWIHGRLKTAGVASNIVPTSTGGKTNVGRNPVWQSSRRWYTLSSRNTIVVDDDAVHEDGDVHWTSMISSKL